MVLRVRDLGTARERAPVPVAIERKSESEQVFKFGVVSRHIADLKLGCGDGLGGHA